MSGNTLFEPPAEFTNRIKALKEQNVKEPTLLLQVELGFALMEQLELDDEPVTAVWAILSGMFIKHPKLQNLSPENKRAIANARQIVPFSARFEWLNALRNYIRKITQDWRNYDFDLRENKSSQIIVHTYLNLPILEKIVKGKKPKIVIGFWDTSIKVCVFPVNYSYGFIRFPN